MKSRPPTRTEWIDDLVRTSIVTGEMAPGTRLVLSELAERYDISVTPLREALARLAVDGLVELRPHGSARVASVSVDDAAEIYAIRRLLEQQALADAIRAADDNDRRRWEEAYEALQTGSTRAGNLRLHADFHRALLAPCPSSWMLRTLAPLQEHSLRVVSSIATNSKRPKGSGEHAKLLKLALAGKADEAAAFLDQHLVNSMTWLSEGSTSKPAEQS